MTPGGGGSQLGDGTVKGLFLSHRPALAFQCASKPQSCVGCGLGDSGSGPVSEVVANGASTRWTGESGYTGNPSTSAGSAVGISVSTARPSAVKLTEIAPGIFRNSSLRRE